MQQQVLQISPDEFIIFTGSILEGNIITILNFHNPLDQNVFFKIKTTKPERYCVSPNHGIILNNNTIPIAIKLKEEGVSPEEISKDKFLIQSILSENVTKGLDAETAFSRVKNANLMETKLKVKAEVENVEYHPMDEDKESNSFKSAKLLPHAKLGKHTTNSIDISDVMMPRCDPSGRTDDLSKELERESTLLDKESNPLMKFGQSGSRILSDDRLGGLFQKNIIERLVTSDSKLDTIRFNFGDRNETYNDHHIKCIIGSLIFGILCFLLGYYFQNIWSNNLAEKYLSNC